MLLERFWNCEVLATFPTYVWSFTGMTARYMLGEAPIFFVAFTTKIAGVGAFPFMHTSDVMLQFPIFWKTFAAFATSKEFYTLMNVSKMLITVIFPGELFLKADC